MTAKATTDRTADTKYTPDVPIQAMPMATPATAGPSTRVVLMLICPSTMAFGSRSLPTNWPVIAMRAGPRKANATACTADDTSSIQYSTKSNATPNPIHADVAAIANWHTAITSRFESRSAITPPNGVAISIGTPNAMYTPPSPVFVPVSSLANHPRAMTCDWTARKAIRPERNSRR